MKALTSINSSHYISHTAINCHGHCQRIKCQILRTPGGIRTHAQSELLVRVHRSIIIINLDIRELQALRAFSPRPVLNELVAEGLRRIRRIRALEEQPVAASRDALSRPDRRGRAGGLGRLGSYDGLVDNKAGGSAAFCVLAGAGEGVGVIGA